MLGGEGEVKLPLHQPGTEKKMLQLLSGQHGLPGGHSVFPEQVFLATDSPSNQDAEEKTGSPLLPA